MPNPTIVRSMLSVPGVRERFIEKALEVPADVILLDLEDSVPATHKTEARGRVSKWLPRFDKRGRWLFVRPNDFATGLLEADLDAVVTPALDGVPIPKVHSVEIVQRVDHYLTLLERVRSIEPGSIRIIAWIESTQGLASVEAICKSSARLVGASFGSEDYATSLGVMRTRSGSEIEYARARMANAAVAGGLVPIDGPEPDYKDLEHVEQDIRHARSLGYRGKYCIHPSQVEIANRIFSPPADQIEWARRVREAYEAGEREGKGAIGLDGAMVDRPVYLRAIELLEWQGAIDARARAIQAASGVNASDRQASADQARP
jgi:citrate lyase subunit beta / citryl-CoA lyase